MKWLGVLAFAGVVAGLRRRRRMDLRDKIAVIFGGSRGLGLALARELVRRGAQVALVARTGEDLKNARDTLVDWEGVEPMIVECDVTRREAVHRAIDEVMARHGRIDVLVNDAGVLVVGPQDHMRVHDFDRAMATHFWGPLYAMEAVVPIMRERGKGRIVNISSIGGRIAVPHLLPYCASKFALVGLSDGMRAELARDGIRVTTVCPGLMRTGSYLNVDTKGRHEAELAWFAVMDSLPGLSMSARRAARRIALAIERGERQLTLGLPAKIAVVAQALMPEAVGGLVTLFGEMLPEARERGGVERRSGWDSRSRWVPSRLTRRSDRAAETYNELRGHTSTALNEEMS